MDFDFYYVLLPGKVRENYPLQSRPNVKKGASLRWISREGQLLFCMVEMGYASLSGAWPSWASHLHSVSSMSVKVARKEESSGLQA